jgi:hypothetical protein
MVESARIRCAGAEQVTGPNRGRTNLKELTAQPTEFEDRLCDHQALDKKRSRLEENAIKPEGCALWRCSLQTNSTYN